MKPNVHFEGLGLMDYKQAWEYQENLFNTTVQKKIALRNGEDVEPTENYLLFVEHPHVYTLGKSGHLDNLLLSDDKLEEHQATFYKINRGGDITYHGPGQLVADPIFDLENFSPDIHKYMRDLEESVILTLKHFGIDAGRLSGMTGVWLDADNDKARKICAMGVKSSRWVTMHGIGFNVNVDLNYFSHIVPCGIQDKAVTSMKQELGHEVDMNEVQMVLKEKLAQVFSFNYAQ